MDRISAFMDGEAERFESEQVLQRLRQDTAWRETWETYHLIGHTMRREYPLQHGFSARVGTQLAAEPTIMAPRFTRRRIVRYALSAAASLAAVAAVATLMFSDNPLRPQAELAQHQPAAAIDLASRSSAEIQAVPAAIGRVNEYLLAHQEFSPSTAIQGAVPYARTVSVTVVENKR